MTYSKIFAFVLIVLFSTSSFALDLKEARAKGMVKELPTGFVEVKGDDPKGVVKELVETVNKKRKAHYKKVATKNKTTVEHVAKQAAAKIQKKLKAK